MKSPFDAPVVSALCHEYFPLIIIVSSCITIAAWQEGEEMSVVVTFWSTSCFWNHGENLSVLYVRASAFVTLNCWPFVFIASARLSLGWAARQRTFVSCAMQVFVAANLFSFYFHTICLHFAVFILSSSIRATEGKLTVAAIDYHAALL